MSANSKSAQISERFFDIDRPLAIVAGGGKLPVLLAEHIAAQSGELFIFKVRANADPALSKYRGVEISAAEIGRLINRLKAEKIDQVVLVGSVTSRPSWKEFRFDLPTLKLAKSIVSGMRSGDDNLLVKIVQAIEAEGITVFGIDQIMPELRMPVGVLAGKAPDAGTQKSVELGVQAAKLLGELDAGQACVVIGHRIVALEGVEGTDAMLDRVADLRKAGRLPDKTGGVLVKVCKPQQDKRVDLPTIGVDTILRAADAKLKGIAVSATHALVVEAESVIQNAEDKGLFVMGIDSDA